MFCHSCAHCFTIEVYFSAVLKQNGNNKYLLSYPGENLMAKLFLFLYYFVLALILLNFFSDFKWT